MENKKLKNKKQAEERKKNRKFAHAAGYHRLGNCHSLK